jgi:D-beta-D-heptose 7-phosphate kinase/D-beta-D-heptose 1-phosphate adenosyltransferase
VVITVIDRCFQARRPKILVVGDIICDVYLHGTVNRISQEAPVPIFECGERRPVLGGAANVAANLQAFGCEIYLVGVVGTDPTAQEVRTLLEKQGIAATWLVADPLRPTTEKTRLVAPQQMLRLDREVRRPLDAEAWRSVVHHACAVLPDVDGVICSDYHKGVCIPEVLKQVLGRARDLGRPVVVDPKARDVAHYRGATVLTPNRLEAERASGRSLHDAAEVEAVGRWWCEQSQADAVLITRGPEGMSLISSTQSPLHILPNAREVYDVTGAGDTVIATFTMAMLSGLDFADAAMLANTAAGVVVGKMGTAVVTPAELRLACALESAPELRKVLTRDELVRAVRQRRQSGERVVFTNGCFDLLHVGHMRYLQQARALGDCLVLGLNDDASVRRLKGDKRPLIPHTERASVLAALACVDYVTIFSEDTPLELIASVRPDVLVKGGDYTPDTVVGRDAVEAYGGEVVLVPFVEGISTTNIIDSVLQRYRSTL